MPIMKKTKRLDSIRDPDENKRPCLECNRRRIKCDFVKPSCGKCEKKNMECHYKKTTKFIHTNIPSISKNRKRIESTSQSDLIHECRTKEVVLCNNISTIELPDCSVSSESFQLSSTNSTDDSISNASEDIEEDESYMSKVSIKGTFSCTITELTNTIRVLSGNNVGSLYYIDESVIHDLYNYFNEIILDQMVPYDDSNSPYRTFLIPSAQKSENMLLTLVCISSEHLHARGILSVEILETFKSIFSIFLDLCIVNLSRHTQIINDIQDDSILPKCLNLLMQISYSIFSFDTTSMKAKYLKSKYCMKLVKNILLKYEPQTSQLQAYRVFVLQRLVFNDVFMSSLNDSMPIIPSSMFEELLKLEENLPTLSCSSDISTMLEIVGCPVEILFIIYEIQIECHNFYEKIPSDVDYDELVVSISRKRAKLELHFSNRLEYYKSNYTKKLSLNISDNDNHKFLSLSDIYYHAAWIILLRKVSQEHPSSHRMIFHIDKLIQIIRNDIIIGSGPDTCIAFPLFIASREATLMIHRQHIMEFFDLSEWHLKLGSQKVVRRLLQDYYWVEGSGSPEELQRVISEEFPFVIY